MTSLLLLSWRNTRDMQEDNFILEDAMERNTIIIVSFRDNILGFPQNFIRNNCFD